MAKKIFRLAGYNVLVLDSLARALREMTDLNIIQHPGWTMSKMSETYGHSDADPHITEHLLVGSMGVILPHKYVSNGTKVRMLAWYTWSYTNWCSGHSEVDVEHHYSLWIALPEIIQQIDFLFSASDNTIKPWSREGELPIWVNRWVENQERKRAATV